MTREIAFRTKDTLYYECDKCGRTMSSLYTVFVANNGKICSKCKKEEEKGLIGVI